MGVRNKNSTNYVHPDEPNLLNLHKSMRYNATGEPQVRVHVDGISLEGDVIVDKVKLWDGTNDLVFDFPNNDNESALWSLPTESHNMVFNGSTWDRMRGDINDGVLVKLSNNNIAVTGTVELGTTTLTALETVTVNQGTTPWQVNGNVIIKEKPTQVSAFGESLAVQVNPVVQLDGIYGINDLLQFQTYSALGGTTSTQDSQMVVAASSTQYSYAVLRSRRALRYRPGQGALARFSVRFSPGIANTSQRAGFFNQENAYQIGYNGTEFGILHQYNGKTHIEELIITTAPTSTQTATITLNNVTKNVTLANESAALTAARIGRETFPGWIVESYDNKVVFLKEGALSPLNGSFSFTSTGNATGTTTALQLGQAATEIWIPQNQWNGELATSGFTLDPTKYNVFQINFRWLGAGEIKFAMENPITGDFITLHHIHWTNQHTIPHSSNPSFKLGYVAYNLGGGAVTVHGGSLMMAVEGNIFINTYPKSSYITKTNLSSGTLHHIATVYNPIVLEGRINTREAILENISLAFQGNDPLNLIIYIDTPLLTGTHQYNSNVNTLTKSSVVTGTFSSNGIQPIVAITLPINGSGNFDLSPYRLVLGPGTSASVAVISNQQISQIAASLIGRQD